GIELAVAGGGADVHRSSPPSRHPAAETRGQDAELFAVLRHGAAGDLEAALVEQLRDVLVRQRLLLVLFLDQGADDVLGGARRDVLAILGLEAAREEELELEDAARGLNVLAAAHPADGGFMHVDLTRHLLQRQRSEERDALVEEL